MHCLDKDFGVLMGGFGIFGCLADIAVVFRELDPEKDVLNMLPSNRVLADKLVKVIESVLVEDEDAKVCVGEVVIPLAVDERYLGVRGVIPGPDVDRFLNVIEYHPANFGRKFVPAGHLGNESCSVGGSIRR